MTYTNHNVKDVSASGAVKAAHGVIVAVYVTKAGAGGDKVVFHNGTANSDPVNLLSMVKVFSMYKTYSEDLKQVYMQKLLVLPLNT